MSPNDNTGLGLFDEAASAAGNFPLPHATDEFSL